MTSTYVQRINRQDTGWCKGINSASLKLANKAISDAKNATPEDERELYRSNIFYMDGGYAWGWVLK